MRALQLARLAGAALLLGGLAGQAGTAAAQTAPIATAWLVNASGATSAIYNAPTDVQSVTVTGQTVTVVSSDIPSYQTTVTPDLLASLAGRTSAAVDFRSGQPAVAAGQTIDFGQDVGYRGTNCQGQPGYGYWPPGPACATVQAHSFTFPLQPRPATGGQPTLGGEIGLWLNGVSVFNWSDMQTYRNQGVWHRTAAVWEADSMDVCGGHSAPMGDYHSHFYSTCLAQQLGDTGAGPSPLWGFAADGYPIYGPWLASGVLARSGWTLRRYPDGQRTTLLVDPADPSQGEKPAAQPGPSTTAIVPGFPGRGVQAVPGAFAEDYYFNRACGDCLDEHNGRDDGDGRGYHYTITVIQAADGSLAPAFPYIVGPTFAGVVPPAWFASVTRLGGGPPPPTGSMR